MNSWDDARSSCSAPQEGYSVRGLWEQEALSEDEEEEEEETEVRGYGDIIYRHLWTLFIDIYSHYV